MSKQLSIDAITLPGEVIVFDVKTGMEKDFHKLAVVGYAMVFESVKKVPVNIGCLLYPKFEKGKEIPLIKCKAFPLSDRLRKEFIWERNRKIEIVLSKRDPGKAHRCPESCLFYEKCFYARED